MTALASSGIHYIKRHSALHSQTYSNRDVTIAANAISVTSRGHGAKMPLSIAHLAAQDR